MDFADPLYDPGYVTRDRLAEAIRNWRGRPDTLGAIALKVGVLTMEQIDALLEEQAHEHKLFGQVAIEREFLTSEQVERLWGIQELDAELHLGKVLVVGGF